MLIFILKKLMKLAETKRIADYIEMNFVIRDNRLIFVGILTAVVQPLAADQLENYVVGC